MPCRIIGSVDDNSNNRRRRLNWPDYKRSRRRQESTDPEKRLVRRLFSVIVPLGSYKEVQI